MEPTRYDEIITLIVTALSLLFAALKQYQNNKLEGEVDRLTKERKVVDEEGNIK